MVALFNPNPVLPRGSPRGRRLFPTPLARADCPCTARQGGLLAQGTLQCCKPLVSDPWTPTRAREGSARGPQDRKLGRRPSGAPSPCVEHGRGSRRPLEYFLRGQRRRALRAMHRSAAGRCARHRLQRAQRPRFRIGRRRGRLPSLRSKPSAKRGCLGANSLFVLARIARGCA